MVPRPLSDRDASSGCARRKGAHGARYLSAVAERTGRRVSELQARLEKICSELGIRG